jgi:hypothetical protein
MSCRFFSATALRPLEAVCDRKEKNLVVKRIWYDADVQRTTVCRMP